MQKEQHEENKHTMDDIDNALDNIVAQTDVQVDNAHQVNTELQEQNVVIDDVNNHMDGTTGNLDKTTKRLKKVEKLTLTCGNIVLFIIMGVLLIIILIIIIFGGMICDSFNCKNKKK